MFLLREFTDLLLPFVTRMVNASLVQGSVTTVRYCNAAAGKAMSRQSTHPMWACIESELHIEGDGTRGGDTTK